MHDLAVADVDPDVADRLVEEHQVAGAQLVARDGCADLRHRPARAWQRDARLLERPRDEAGAVEGVRPARPVAVRRADLAHGVVERRSPCGRGAGGEGLGQSRWRGAIVTTGGTVGAAGAATAVAGSSPTTVAAAAVTIAARPARAGRFLCMGAVLGVAPADRSHGPRGARGTGEVRTARPFFLHPGRAAPRLSGGDPAPAAPVERRWHRAVPHITNAFRSVAMTHLSICYRLSGEPSHARLTRTGQFRPGPLLPLSS